MSYININKCDVCGKETEDRMALAILRVAAYRLKPFIKNINAEACSVACMARLLRDMANEIDPESVCTSGGYRSLPGIVFVNSESTDFNKAPPTKKSGFFARLFRMTIR
jgi:hypothetical protein